MTTKVTDFVLNIADEENTVTISAAGSISTTIHTRGAPLIGIRTDANFTTSDVQIIETDETGTLSSVIKNPDGTVLTLNSVQANNTVYLSAPWTAAAKYLRIQSVTPQASETVLTLTPRSIS